MARWSALVLCFGFFIASPAAMAQSNDPVQMFREGLALWQNAPQAELKQQGVDMVRAAATRGVREAQYFAGLAFRNGDGVAQNTDIAVYWIEKAAAAGEMRALNLLAAMYLHGEGVVPNPLKALEWYERGARAGDVIALHNAATMLVTGQAGVTDYARAQQFLETAARLGHVPSQRKLPLIAEMIREGAIAPVQPLPPEGQSPQQPGPGAITTP